jgi:hypothetical protein
MSVVSSSLAAQGSVKEQGLRSERDWHWARGEDHRLKPVVLGLIVRVWWMCEYREEHEGPWKPRWQNMSR